MEKCAVNQKRNLLQIYGVYSKHEILSYKKYDVMFDLSVITVLNVDLKLFFFAVMMCVDSVLLSRFNFFQTDSFNILTRIHVVWHING